MSYAADHFEGILQLWYPGARGGNAVAEILFGKESPSGKLPITFYESLNELPPFEDYSMEGRTYRYMKGKAQYPFGYGLTYGEAAVESACAKWEGSGATVSAVLCNTGNVKICEVLQVYMKCEDHEKAVPNPQLCGFQRVELLPGEKKTVTISIPERSFTVVDDNGCRFIGGEKFSLYVGLSQPDERSIELTGKQPVKIDLCKA